MAGETKVDLIGQYDRWVVDCEMCEPATGTVAYLPVSYDPEIRSEVVILWLSTPAARLPEGANVVGAYHAEGDDAARRFCREHGIDTDAIGGPP